MDNLHERITNDLKLSGLIVNRRIRLKSHPKCFVGSEVVQWMMSNYDLSSEEAVTTGQAMLQEGIFKTVNGMHDFEDKYLLYRLYDDEEHGPILNQSKIAGTMVGGTDLLTTSCQLLCHLLSITKFYDGERDEIKRSVEYEEFLKQICVLQTADLGQIHQHKLIFWVNVFNLLSLHSSIELGAKKLKHFMDHHQYFVGQVGAVSLHEIYHGILRGNRSPGTLSRAPFKDSDPRFLYICDHVDPSVHFLLNYHVKSCNQIAVLFTENYLEDIRAVICEYFQYNIIIRDSDITLPYLFKQYKKDFPINKEDLLHWILSFSVESDKYKLDELIKSKGNSIKIKYASFDSNPAPLTKLKFTRVIEEEHEEGKEEEEEFKDVQLQV